jgi:hypothetical protein
MRNVSEKVIEEIKTHIFAQRPFFFFFFSFENRAACEIMWENIVAQGRPRMKIWRMRIVCWIPKATNTQLVYVIHIAFSVQQ